MEIKILEESDKRLLFELEGFNQAVLRALKAELYEDASTKAAGFSIEHPLINKVKFLVEAPAPRKTLEAAIKRLSKKAEKLIEDLKSF